MAETGKTMIIQDWASKYLRRVFTVRSNEHEPTELLQLKNEDLYSMRHECDETYEAIFNEGFLSLHKAMSIKLHCIEKCQEKLENWVKKIDKDKEDLSYNFPVLTTEEVKTMSLKEIRRKYQFVE